MGRSTRALLVVDLGVLAQVRDSLGHARATAAADDVAALLDRACAAVWAAGGHRTERLADDRFAVRLPGVDALEALRRADDLHERLLGPCTVDGVPFAGAVRIGVAADPDGPGPGPGSGPGRDDAALLRRAEIALAAARRGGPPVRLWDVATAELAARRCTLARDFDAAVTGGDVRVHYQPMVCLDRGVVIGVEALARWMHPDLGSLLPDEFVPVVEESGQIGTLTRVVLADALGAARRWLDRGLRLSVAVNVAASTLAVPSFPEDVDAALRRHGVPPDLLTLEITESGLAAEREAARPALDRLAERGLHVAVDDFGTGQSSLAHLRGLPIDMLKIDKGFVLGMAADRADAAVVGAVVEMGHALGLTVIAEGVEQPAVRRALVAMGCDVGQGYQVSRPLPPGCLDRWMSTLDVAGTPRPGEGPRTLIA